MTNAEKFKTVEERATAFIAFCDSHDWLCTGCPVINQCDDKYGPKAAFAWLDLEAEDEKPLPCPFCGGECKTIELFLERDHYVICDKCRYASARGLTEAEAIAAHNRVARKCMGSEVKNETN